MHSNNLVDAEDVIAQNIKDESNHQSEIEVPQPLNSKIDLTEELVADEFVVMDDISDEVDVEIESLPEEEKLNVVEQDSEEAIL